MTDRLAMKVLVVGGASLSLLAASAPARAGATPQEQTNAKTVAAFYDAAINQKDFDGAARYLGSRYVQHNPTAADGREGLHQFVQHLKDKAPAYHSEVVQTFTDGDFVILHVRNSPAPGAQDFAVIDIFRLDHGKIVEHWDVKQPVPASAANSNGMF